MYNCISKVIANGAQKTCQNQLSDLCGPARDAGAQRFLCIIIKKIERQVEALFRQESQISRGFLVLRAPVLLALL